MNTFEPGRVYSGIYLSIGKRIIVMRGTGDEGSDFTWTDGETYYDEGELVEISGPLVVLDDPHTPMNAVALALREAGFDYLAHQIEEQTRPPLQDGWHEVEHSHWIGRTVRELREGEWYTVPGHRDATQNWTSTHYIGPGSGDAS